MTPTYSVHQKNFKFSIFSRAVKYMQIMQKTINIIRLWTI